jgi:hypothetical protein
VVVPEEAAAVELICETSLVCDIVIRSYWKDLEWLSFCLAAITKYCHGFRSVVVILPRSTRPWLRRFALPGDMRVEWCRDYRDDYLGQQATKLLSDTFTDAEYICHVDSDCIFFRPTSPYDLMDNGKPRIMKRRCELLGRHWPWRRPTERFLGWPVTDDFMEHPPFLFPSWIYAEIRAHALLTHGVDLESYIEAQPARGFSEFNVLGAYAWERHRERFAWLDTSVNMPVAPRCRWYWSWGGIDQLIRAEIEKTLELPAGSTLR